MKRNRRLIPQKTFTPILPVLLVLALWALSARSASAQHDVPHAVALPVTDRASAAAPPLNCAGSASGFDLTIDTAHSSVSGSSVICNYVAKTQGKNPVVSGFAVTAEYFCAKDTQSAWKSKTAAEAPWAPGTNPNGEISRSGTVVLFREDGEVTGFAGTFLVTEKMFLLIDAQTIATIVVHTDIKHPDAPASGPAPNPDPKVLNLDATQVAGVATAVAGAHHALVNSLVCTSAAATAPAAAKGLPQLYPQGAPSAYTINAGDTIRISGVVWARENGLLKLPGIQFKLQISDDSGGGASSSYTTEADGYFDVPYTVTDVRGDDSVKVTIDAASPDPNRYANGSSAFVVDVRIKGGLHINATTGKAIYNVGEPVTIVGSVTSNDKLVQASLDISSDSFPALQQATGADGSFELAFTPGKEPKRTDMVVPGVHRIVIKARAPGYGENYQTVSYLIQYEGEACSPVGASVAGLTGHSYTTPLDPELASRILSSGTVNAQTKLTQGIRIGVDAGGQVTFRVPLEGGATATVVLNGPTELQIGRLCKDASGNVQVVLSQSGAGQLAINMSNPAGSTGALNFRIVTPAVTVKSLKTRYFINVDGTGTTTVAALEGAVLVADPQGANGVELPAVNMLVVHPGEEPDASQISPLSGQLDPSLEGWLGGTAQPDTNVTNMTLQAARRRVFAGDLVLVPVWLIKATSVANLNVQLKYDPAVVQPDGAIQKGDLIDNALFTTNPNQSGTVLAAFAQTGGVAGTGTIFNIPFRVVGKPGNHTALDLIVTAVNDPGGARLIVERISGEVLVYNKDGTFPTPGGDPNAGQQPPDMLRGDCDGDGALTELDALCALEMSTQIRPANLLMDLDNSGDVTSRDAVIILQKALGK